jgi:hypothetical protein
MRRLALLSLPLGLLFAACSDTTAPSAPPPPDGVTAIAAAGEILINWTARAPATSYNIYRSSTHGLTANTGMKIATVSNPFTDSGTAVYGDSGLVIGSTYYYVVTAVNAHGESAPSVEVNATPVGITAPPPPAGVTATSTTGELLISWIAQPPATSYNIYRSNTTGLTAATGTKIATVPNPFTDSGTAVYGDSGLAVGSTYYYVVTAVNAHGESAPSVEVNATRLGVPPLAITSAAPPAGAVGIAYGPTTSRLFVCTPVRSATCTPCTLGPGCLQLPACPTLNGRGQCKKSMLVAVFPFQATGGTPPYSWSSPDLPAGLSLGASNGWLTGIPSAAGTFTVTVILTDAAAPTDSVVTHYTIEITP